MDVTKVISKPKLVLQYAKSNETLFAKTKGNHPRLNLCVVLDATFFALLFTFEVFLERCKTVRMRKRGTKPLKVLTVCSSTPITGFTERNQVKYLKSLC